MKSIVILCVFVTMVAALDQVVVKLQPEMISALQNLGETCAKEFNVDPAMTVKVMDGSLPRDEASNKFLHCLSLKANYIKEDGHLNVQTLVDVVKNHPLAEEFKNAIAKCDEVTKENPVAVAQAIHTCYTNTSPLVFSF